MTALAVGLDGHEPRRHREPFRDDRLKHVVSETAGEDRIVRPGERKQTGLRDGKGSRVEIRGDRDEHRVPIQEARNLPGHHPGLGVQGRAGRRQGADGKPEQRRQQRRGDRTTGHGSV